MNRVISVTHNANIILIGDRFAGKTAYMTALAYWPNSDLNSAVKAVTPIGEATNQLVINAQNILEQGLQLEGTFPEKNVDDIVNYTISINLYNISKKKDINLNVSLKEYSGDFFSDFLYRERGFELQEYFEYCGQSKGILFMLDGTSYRKDLEYAKMLERFLTKLNTVKSTLPGFCIACVLTKCEQPELWVNRNQPRVVAQMRFPKVHSILNNWVITQNRKVDYFLTSAFGVLGSQFSEPNAKNIRRNQDGICSVLKEPKKWRPFGLLAPIYWICCDSHSNQLEQY